ncbi:MAG: hypothetical protein EA397_03135 [Deltaproteobacteria bacterium]|nr:MAG: hypothetical protein EA397_03135 [Deltaproteobacteria bacterium]
MTPTALRRALRANEPTRRLADLPDPQAILRGIEAALDREPAAVALRALMEPAFDFAWATAGLPPVIAGVRWSTLVRWDRSTVTLLGQCTRSGAEVLLRTLRAQARRPIWRRALQRDAELLRALPHLPFEVREDQSLSLVTRLPGAPLCGGATLPPLRAIRVTLGALSDLIDREQQQWPLLDPDELELRECAAGARIISLSVQGAPGATLAPFASTLLALSPDSPLAPALRGCVALPSDRPSDLGAHLVRALAVDLAGLRHHLSRSYAARRDRFRRARLVGLIRALERFPPPVGRAVVGHDLEGNPILLHSDGRTMQWGPPDGPQLAVLTSKGLHPRAARRMLRVRAEGRSDPTTGAEADFLDHACRWTSAALSLRTLSRLLDATD